MSQAAQIEIIQIPVGKLQSNCYIIYLKESKKALIIDPGEQGPTIVKTIKELNLKPSWIILTHGHGDHIGAIGFMKDQFDLKIAIHRDEELMLSDARANLSGIFGEPVLAPPADKLLDDGDEIDFEGLTIKVLHTPGHSPGSVSFLLDNHLFTGDALFKDTVGRTDLPGGSHVKLTQSIRDKILVLNDDIIVYPGHGPTTTVGEERRNNPYLQEIMA